MMAAAAILKIRKIAISSQCNDQFNIDATGPFRYRQQIKIHDLENPRWPRRITLPNFVKIGHSINNLYSP